MWGQPIKLAQEASTSEVLQNQRNTLFSLKLFPVISAGLQKYKHETGHNYLVYFSTSKKVRGLFLIIEIREIFQVNEILNIAFFGGHEVLKLYSMC